ncbi:MAG TPA: hypothetical protein ENO21_04335 [Firmicutes bacterium]|nr:hypothetical protein [Bacillota bacterium]
MDELREKQRRPAARGRGRPVWLLVVAAVLAVAAGAAYLWKWQQGLRGVDLLGFTSLWVALPLALALILMFFYFSKPKAR